MDDKAYRDSGHVRDDGTCENNSASLFALHREN